MIHSSCLGSSYEILHEIPSSGNGFTNRIHLHLHYMAIGFPILLTVHIHLNVKKLLTYTSLTDCQWKSKLNVFSKWFYCIIYLLLWLFSSISTQCSTTFTLVSLHWLYSTLNFKQNEERKMKVIICLLFFVLCGSSPTICFSETWITSSEESHLKFQNIFFMIHLIRREEFNFLFYKLNFIVKTYFSKIEKKNFIWRSKYTSLFVVVLISSSNPRWYYWILCNKE